MICSCLVAIVFALPEPAAISADIPVGKLFDHESLDGVSREIRRIVKIVLTRFTHHLVEPGDDPAVEQRPLNEGRGSRRIKRIKPIKSRICYEERIRVPERQDESAPDLIGDMRAEVEILARRVRAEEPTHRI